MQKNKTKNENMENILNISKQMPLSVKTCTDVSAISVYTAAFKQAEDAALIVNKREDRSLRSSATMPGIQTDATGQAGDSGDDEDTNASPSGD